MRLRAFAPAKVNLFLHVAPPRADGKHPLAGLSVFADAGDVLTLDPEGPPGLRVEGVMAAGVPTGPDNLVMRALAGFTQATGIATSGLSITLDKRLPSASGIGGGTSDAGAALRLARAFLAPDLPDQVLLDMAENLGADGPMCVFPRVMWTQGLGERLTPEPRLLRLHAVLVNPGVAVSTGAVFAAYDADPVGDASLPPPPGDWSGQGVVDWLAGLRNDLQSPAQRLCPQIEDAVAMLDRMPGVALARMSGSGATVFGLCDDAAAADHAAKALRAARPEWWVTCATLGKQTSSIASIPAP